MNRTAFLNLAIALVILFRYIRANGKIMLFFFSLFFMGMAIYLSKNNAQTIAILSAIAIVTIFMSILKEKRHPFILKLQKGYKPVEYIWQSILFIILIWLILIVFYKG
jgi:hypothetical protein